MISPKSGPPGTTVKLSAGGCPRPDGWTDGGEIYFGLNNPRATGTAGEDPVKGQRVWVSSTAAWQDQLVIPAGLAPGPYSVWATCYRTSPVTYTWSEFSYYPLQDFAVT